MIVTSKKMVDPSQYLVTDGHIYKRIDIPNASSKQWRLEELDIEEAIMSMISDFGGRSDEPWSIIKMHTVSVHLKWSKNANPSGKLF